VPVKGSKKYSGPYRPSAGKKPKRPLSSKEKASAAEMKKRLLKAKISKSAKTSPRKVSRPKMGIGKIIARYTVKKGDTLSGIAKKYYGHGTRPYWELIQNANRAIIKDANLINPGQVFKIPEAPAGLKE
jgi:nucleoid-associated protein YgaU